MAFIGFLKSPSARTTMKAKGMQWIDTIWRAHGSTAILKETFSGDDGRRWRPRRVARREMWLSLVSPQ
jgi:hypothetical protein